MRDITRDNQCPGEAEPCFHWMLAERAEDIRHRLIEIDPDRIITVIGNHIRQEAGRVTFKPFDKNAVSSDLSHGLSVGGT